MVLPNSWKERLGEIETIDKVELETANQDFVQGEICGPIRIQIEGFRPIYNEVVFVEMKPKDGVYEPLIGYIILEQSQATVDMIGHRLVKIKRMDLKSTFVKKEISIIELHKLFETIKFTTDSHR